MRLWRWYRMVCRLNVDSRCLSKALLPALVGLCLGVTVSMMYAPFSEDSCETYVARQDPQKMIKLRDTRSLDSAAEDSVGGDLYEPRQLEPAYKLDTKAGSKFYRPKFAATELGIRQKLFVAVLSSKTTLNSLAVAVNKTLSGYVTKTVFFVDERASVVPAGMMIINFADGYNHLMPINVFKYIIKKYGHDYDYFMFTTDKAYIRAEKVFDLVSHISVSRHVYMGVPTGTAQGGKAYCTLDGGVVISQSLLSLVNASIHWCSDNCHHSDQSLNFGKCMAYVTDLQCQGKGGENKEYKTFPVKNFDFTKDIGGLKEQPDFNDSLSVFPMPDDVTHYKLHRYFCEVELNTTRRQIQDMKDNIVHMSQFAPGGRDSITWPIGVPEPYKPKNRFDVIRWDYFTETHIYFQDDFTNVKELIGVDKLDIQDVIKISMEKLNKKYDNKYLYSYLVNGYRRFDPQRGMEYILDLALDDTSRSQNGDDDSSSNIVEKRVFLVRPLGEVEIVPMPYVAETTRVNIVLPLTVKDMDAWGGFLETYAKLQGEAGDSLGLVVVLIYSHPLQSGEEDPFSVLRSMIRYYNDKNEEGLKTTTLNYIANTSYTSEFQLMDLVSSNMASDSLLFMCSIGMELNIDMLNRVRINTISGWQVFFPIGFWQFKPNLIYDKKPYPSEIEFTSKAGHYDILSYEHGSFFNSDYKEAHKFMSESDLKNFDVYEMFVQFGEIHVFRAVEPEFKHRYQQLECQNSGPEKVYRRCEERKSLGLATRAQLAKRIFQYQARASASQNANSKH